MQKKQHGNIRLVSAVVNGISMQINPASIDKGSRSVLHGEYKEVTVNSPEICKLGDKPSDSVLLWPEAGKPHVSVMSIAAASVFATKFLQSEGHTVTIK